MVKENPLIDKGRRKIVNLIQNIITIVNLNDREVFFEKLI